MPLKFSDSVAVLASKRIWHYDHVGTNACADVAAATQAALEQPDDFPPLMAAVVAGDRVTLAVDPYVPQIDEVVRGVIRAMAKTDAASVDVVLWDEATDETIEKIRGELAPAARVVRHRSEDRRGLSYLAADQAGDPIYLNRLLVDADFVLPIIAGRPSYATSFRDSTGIYPWLADSAARIRFRDTAADLAVSNVQVASETSWLLGVQMMVSVAPSIDGLVHRVEAGTIDAIEKRLHREPTDAPEPTETLQRTGDPPAPSSDESLPPPAALIVASIDGNRQQQTWANAVRAAMSARRHVLPGGTIVLWTAIADLPTDRVAVVNEDDSQTLELPSSGDQDAEFPDWDPSVDVTKVFADITDEYRLMVHAAIDEQIIEAMGLGSISDEAGLQNLSRVFDTCGVLRVAQFA